MEELRKKETPVAPIKESLPKRSWRENYLYDPKKPDGVLDPEKTEAKAMEMIKSGKYDRFFDGADASALSEEERYMIKEGIDKGMWDDYKRARDPWMLRK